MLVARKLGVVTYRWMRKWDRHFRCLRLKRERRTDAPFDFEVWVESYLEGHARRFSQFDLNCHLYLSRSMDWFDLGESCAPAPTPPSKCATSRSVVLARAAGSEPAPCQQCASD